jgi:hypothetical protein
VTDSHLFQFDDLTARLIRALLMPQGITRFQFLREGRKKKTSRLTRLTL